VPEHWKEKTGDEDLVEFAAIQTLLNGGILYAEKRPRYRPRRADFYGNSETEMFNG